MDDETITNSELLRAIGVGANCNKEICLPYAVAWVAAALVELAGHDGLTRAQASAYLKSAALHER